MFSSKSRRAHHESCCNFPELVAVKLKRCAPGTALWHRALPALKEAPEGCFAHVLSETFATRVSLFSDPQTGGCPFGFPMKYHRQWVDMGSVQAKTHTHTHYLESRRNTWHGFDSRVLLSNAWPWPGVSEPECSCSAMKGCKRTWGK